MKIWGPSQSHLGMSSLTIAIQQTEVLSERHSPGSLPAGLNGVHEIREPLPSVCSKVTLLDRPFGVGLELCGAEGLCVSDG